MNSIVIITEATNYTLAPLCHLEFSVICKLMKDNSFHPVVWNMQHSYFLQKGNSETHPYGGWGGLGGLRGPHKFTQVNSLSEEPQLSSSPTVRRSVVEWSKQIKQSLPKQKKRPLPTPHLLPGPSIVQQQ